MLAHRDCALRTQYQEGKMKGLLRKAAAVLLVAVMAVAMFLEAALKAAVKR